MSTGNIFLSRNKKNIDTFWLKKKCLINLLAEKFSCSAWFSKKELAIVTNLRFNSMKNFHALLSCV